MKYDIGKPIPRARLSLRVRPCHDDIACYPPLLCAQPQIDNQAPSRAGKLVWKETPLYPRRPVLEFQKPLSTILYLVGCSVEILLEIIIITLSLNRFCKIYHERLRCKAFGRFLQGIPPSPI